MLLKNHSEAIAAGNSSAGNDNTNPHPSAKWMAYQWCLTMTICFWVEVFDSQQPHILCVRLLGEMWLQGLSQNVSFSGTAQHPVHDLASIFVRERENQDPHFEYQLNGFKWPGKCIDSRQSGSRRKKKKAFDYYGNLNAMIEDWLERGPGFFRVIKKRVNDLFWLWAPREKFLSLGRSWQGSFGEKKGWLR